ncbi:MAG: hypothetical protein E7294_03345 [Lachnospiraceae bacterium]|nr:hypothetical protein [Lachnospiraceae bacterium]
MLIIQPIGGLCNRMRAINSAWMLAKDRGDSLTVIWNINQELGAPFEALFEPSPKFHVINIHSKWNPKKLFLQTTSRFVNNEEIKAHKGDGLLDEAFRVSLPSRVYISTEEHFYPCHSYELFTPVPSIQQKIRQMTRDYSSHPVGVHIRRTDNLPSIGKSSTEAFIDSMDKELKEHPDTIFYLATDDRTEESRLRDAFGDLILSNKDRDLSRNSTAGIRDAMIDLYALASTKKIIGSYFSSFTDIAADMHGIPKVIAGEENENS